ncbi:ABC transporter substrate-binding protein, partial [Streptomyces sp. NPDC054840]
LAEVDRAGADRIALARRDAAGKNGPGAGGAPAHGPGAALTPAQATLSWATAFGADEEKAAAETESRQKHLDSVKRYAQEQTALKAFTVRKSLEPAYTQLAMNGASGPLADERVRRAVARALDRQALAEAVLKPLGLPAQPVGSHLALAGQRAYADNSDALGGQDTQAAQALLADAGWRKGGKITEPAGAKAGPESAQQDDPKTPSGPGTGNDGLYIVGQDDGANGDPRSATEDRTRTDAAPEGAQDGPSPVLAPAPFGARQQASLLAQAAQVARAAREDATDDATDDAADDATDDAKGVPARDGDEADPAKASPAPAPAKQPARTSGGMLAKDGKALSLRFVLPAGPGSESLRTVGERIARMLRKVGVNTETIKVADDSFFKDHIASGQYDLALYSWPATAYPATDARPIFAKPEPAADGSLLVEQNYTRVGTDHIDQLFDQAVGELDEEQSRELMRKADARIWAAAGSIPLFQRPELVAVKPGLVNVGAFGLGAPRYQDIGWKKAPAAKD